MMLQVKQKTIATSPTRWGWSNSEAVLLTPRRSSQTCCSFFPFLFFSVVYSSACLSMPAVLR